MNHPITIDRWFFLGTALLVLYATTRWFAGDMAAFVSWVVILSGVCYID